MSALIGAGGTVVLWDLEDKKVRHQSDRHGAVIDVAYSPDEKRAVSSHWSARVILWDLATGEIIREFAGHDGVVSSVNFSPNGKLLFSNCGSDRTIRIWDVATGKEIGRVVAESHCTRHSAISSDGRTVVSGGGYYLNADTNEHKRDGDYALRLWQVTDETNSEKHGPPVGAAK